MVVRPTLPRHLRPVLPAVLVFGASFACSAGDLSPGEAADAKPPGRAEQDADRDGDGDDDPPPPSTVRERGPFREAEDPCAAPAEPGLHHVDLPFQGETSRALLYIPSSPGPHDLVVLLHGGSATAQKVLAQTRFAEQAERDGVVVLVPIAADLGGHGPHWNTGKFETLLEKGDYQRDDVAFLDAVTREVEERVCARRVLAAGFSNGGQMAHRWGCEGKEVDGILTAAGELLVDPKGCRPRPVRGYVGTLDKVFDGPPLEGSDQPSAPETIEMWAKINGCNDETPTETSDGEVSCRDWQGCRESTQLCVVEGFPHGWPSPWHKKKPIRANPAADGITWFRSTESRAESKGRDRER